MLRVIGSEVDHGTRLRIPPCGPFFLKYSDLAICLSDRHHSTLETTGQFHFNPFGKTPTTWRALWGRI